MIFQVKAQVVGKEKIGSIHYRLRLTGCSQIANNAQPGQFLHIRCQSKESIYNNVTHSGFKWLCEDIVRYRTIDTHNQAKCNAEKIKESFLILRRPFSIHRICGEEIEILFKVVGKGTKILSEKEIGQEIDILGPLGKGFKIDSNLENAILVSGGIGIAPLYALAEKLSEYKKNVYILMGLPDKESISLSFSEIKAEVMVATEKRQEGLYHGLVTAMFLDFLDKQKDLPDKEVFACGPCPMLKEIANISKSNTISCQVLLEERMGCGIGACMSCVCKTYKKGYSRVCIDGPVFDANDVIWE